MGTRFMNRYLLILFLLSSWAHSYSDEDITWLAKNVYFEARNQGIAGQLSVAHVTLNRVHDKRFPNTIKEVVTQGLTRKSWRDGKPFPIKNKCQFSWFCDGKHDRVTDTQAYQKIMQLVKRLLTNRYDGLIEGATHYHADYVNPKWSKTKTLIGQVDDHIFYRWD